MSRRGIASGLPDAGDRMLFADSMRMRASACASADSGRWTAIWSPSKSALNASQTSGCSWIALPSTSCGSKAWMPRRCRGGARVSRPRGPGLSAVEKQRVLGDALLEHVPHLRAAALDHPLGGLDVLRVVQVHQPLH